MERNLFQNFKAVLGQYRIQLIKATLMVLISNVLLILNPMIFRQAILWLTPFSEPEPSMIAYIMGPLTESILAWVILLLCVAATASFFKYQMRIAFLTISRDVERQIRSKLFERIQSQSMAFFDRHGIGDLLSRLTNDISAYRDLLGPGIMYPLFSLTLVIPGFIALFTISPMLASLALAPILLIPILNLAIRGPIYHTSATVQKALGEISNMTQEHYSGIRIIKSYVIEETTFDQFKKLCSDLAKLNFKLSCMQGLLFPFFTLIAKTITILLILFSGLIILKAWGDLSAADFVSFMWIQSYIFFPVLMLGWVLPIYQRGRAAYDRLVEIYDEPIEVQDTEAISQLRIPKNATIQFHDLTFAYHNSNTPAIASLNLKIEGGSFVGITGPIGAGKSTLFRLLNREYEIPKGMISIAGHDIHEYPLEAFQQAMVTVEQIPFLFSKSIAENVRFGRKEAAQEEVELVTSYADLHETVLDFPEQYDTIVGERGVTLSGGQKQRLAMARAFLVNRSILLLDDIFSAVDSETEKRIFQMMQKNFSDKTVLLISHRVSILEQMDRIVYMKNGQIIEEGSPDTLMKQKGHYSALVDLQQMGINHT